MPCQACGPHTRQSPQLMQVSACLPWGAMEPENKPGASSSWNQSPESPGKSSSGFQVLPGVNGYWVPVLPAEVLRCPQEVTPCLQGSFWCHRDMVAFQAGRVLALPSAFLAASPRVLPGSCCPWVCLLLTGTHLGCVSQMVERDPQQRGPGSSWAAHRRAVRADACGVRRAGSGAEAGTCLPACPQQR